MTGNGSGALDAAALDQTIVTDVTPSKEDAA
jgi:hypothetical protein